ncbi:unnamed protein product (mitochondrion) [Plasmodiophora brassicae]|uniref:Uncharacterized protein n=1 Tax=Plasmodiophora brassicae TaxID=37360 RepID=A0A3P3Y211_PLABS|nr:unnamed protein product [Plasmodiophora brassicae]
MRARTVYLSLIILQRGVVLALSSAPYSIRCRKRLRSRRISSKSTLTSCLIRRQRLALRLSQRFIWFAMGKRSLP